MSRPFLRTLVVSATAGVLSVSVAWAGAGLLPVDPGADDAAEDVAGFTETVPVDEIEADVIRQVGSLDAGQVMAGAARVSIEPDPGEEHTWQTEGCATFGSDAGVDTLTHVPDFSQSRWPEKTDCIYMGGYGIGPMNPITSWDQEHGLHVRSVALGDGEDTVVLTLIDAVYYMGRYQEMCEDCGSLDIAERLGAELRIDPSGFFIAATHSHTAPDLIGGWGGVPEWYMDQVHEAIETSIEQAVASMRPAVLEVGETIAREYNAERRDTYRSAEEPAMTWLRATAVSDDPAAGNRRDRDDAEVIAIVGAYAAHPVTRDAGSGVAHGDWPAVFASHLEDQGAGVAMALATGLGNISPRNLDDHGAHGLTEKLPQLGAGTLLEDPDIETAAHRWNHPVTNPVLTALAAPGFFDRPFEAGPAAVSVGTHPARPCASSSAVAVATQVNAARIGPLLVTGAPGEIFSNLSNTIKESNPYGFTMPLGMTNDGLGYIIQSFESDDGARQGPGFVAGQAGFEYEDAYSIDGCFGDAVLEYTLGLLPRLASDD